MKFQLTNSFKQLTDAEYVNIKILFRAPRYSKINFDLALSCLKIQDNNRYNIYIQ